MMLLHLIGPNLVAEGPSGDDNAFEFEYSELGC